MGSMRKARSVAERILGSPPRGRVDLALSWSVVGAGVLLAGGSFVAGAVDISGGGLEVLVPLTVSVAIAAAGVWLRGQDLQASDVAVVAVWVLATAAMFGVVVSMAAVVMSSDPLRVSLAISSFMAPIGAGGGAVVGYYDAKRRRQHRVTRRAERALETATDGIAIVDTSGQFETVNRAYAEMHGRADTDALVGEHWQEVLPDDESTRIERDVLPSLAHRREWRGEATGRRADGDTFPLELTLTRMPDGGTVCVAHDVSDREAAEREIRAQKRQLDVIVENTPIVIVAFDTDGEITLSQWKGLDRLGLEPGEVVGESVFELYAEFPDVVSGCRRALDGESVHRTHELGDAVFDTWLTPVFEDGEVTQAIGTSVDVTERHERKHQIAAIHEASRRLTYANTFEDVAEAAVAITDEVLDRPLSALWRYDEGAEQLTVAETSDELAATVEEANQTLEPLEEGTVGMSSFKNGEVFVVEDYAADDRAAFPELDLGTVGLVPVGGHGLLSVGHEDVAEVSEVEATQLEILQLNLQAALDRAEHEALLRQRTEELEIRTSQMEFINSILRHDVLNGMTVIRARGEFLEEALEDTQREYAETVVHWCEDIIGFVERVQSVLNALSDDEDLSVRPVDATELLSVELDRLRQTYPEVDFEDHLPEEAWVRADELLGDVLGNIARNAVEHNPQEDLQVEVSIDQDDDTTTVRIADDGQGIPPERRDVVFRRGESHAKSTGSGFGLFFVEAMVDAYGGDVRIEDNEPGAALVIELPTERPDEAPKRETR